MIPRLTRRICTLDAPVEGAAWIPLAELRDRLHELPPKGGPLHLIGPGREFLAHGGRSLTDDPGEPGERLWSPNPMLEPCPPADGLAVDLGCGAGREAVWLALHGWRVLAIDRLPDAIARGRSLARIWHVEDRIEWRVGEVGGPIPADLTVMFRFFCSGAIPATGAFLGEFFSDRHRDLFGKPTLAPSAKEVAARVPGGTVEEAEREGGIRTVRVRRQG